MEKRKLSFYANVCIGERVLKTVKVQYCNPEVMGTTGDLYCLLNNDYSFPDSDMIYCEDIHGYRYKRVFPYPAVNGFFYFQQI